MSDPLRDTIRAKLRAGILRSDAAARAWYGPGQDHPCAACDGSIGQADRECEADFADGVTLRFHRECFYVWDDERHARPDEQRRPDEACAISAAILTVALCLPCIVEKTGVPASRVRAFFARITASVTVTRARAQCAACGLETTTYRIG